MKKAVMVVLLVVMLMAATSFVFPQSVEAKCNCQDYPRVSACQCGDKWTRRIVQGDGPKGYCNGPLPTDKAWWQENWAVALFGPGVVHCDARVHQDLWTTRGKWKHQ